MNCLIFCYVPLIMLILVMQTCTGSLYHHYHKGSNNVQQRRNEMQTLQESFQHGWNKFCNIEINKTALRGYRGTNSSDVNIYFLHSNGRPFQLEIDMWNGQQLELHFNRTRTRTIIFVNSLRSYSKELHFNVHEQLVEMQKFLKEEANVFVVHLAENLVQLYFTFKHNLQAVAKHISEFLMQIAIQTNIEDVILIGHSVGANVAALAADHFNQHPQSQGIKIGHFIAIDPAGMCDSGDFYVKQDVCSHVTVIHGKLNQFGVNKDRRGDTDIYINNVGDDFANRMVKYGYPHSISNHIYPLLFFLKSLTTPIPAININAFIKRETGRTSEKETIIIGYDKQSAGIFLVIQGPAFRDLPVNITGKDLNSSPSYIL